MQRLQTKPRAIPATRERLLSRMSEAVEQVLESSYLRALTGVRESETSLSQYRRFWHSIDAYFDLTSSKRERDHSLSETVGTY